jgi:hypothetical protein
MFKKKGQSMSIADMAINYVKKAPKKGRTYTQILEHIARVRDGVCYDHEYDRGLLGGNNYYKVVETCEKRGNRWVYAS